jgi:hypothetical protein
LVVSKYWLGIDTIPYCIGIVLVQLIGFDLGFFSCISSFDLSGVNRDSARSVPLKTSLDTQKKKTGLDAICSAENVFEIAKHENGT